MNLDDQKWIRPRRQVQTVDVLGHEGGEFAGVLEGRERSVRGVGLWRVVEESERPLPGADAHIGRRGEGVNVRQALRRGIGGPDTVGSAKVGYSRGGGDARSREHDDRR